MSLLPTSAPVLVSGAGPCGLTLAIELGRRGIQTLVIDPKLETATNPQANATQARTMEYFRRLGFADEVRAQGLPSDYPTDIAYFTRYADAELARFSLPSAAQARTMVTSLSGSWSAAELPHRVSQKFVEQILHRHAVATPGVTLGLGHRLLSFDERDDGVGATIEEVATGQLHQVQAKYLVGADGARSTVRRQLGYRYTGETGVVRDFFGGRMAAIYLRAPGFYRTTNHPPAWMYWAFNPERRSWLAAVNGVDEFAFHTQLKPHEEARPLDEAFARELFAQAMGQALDFEIIALDSWVAGHALVSESLGTKRVLIGGDAAHLFTPAGGLGYNTAVEDAVNLGWKLAAVLNGQAAEPLIDSYRYERRKVAVRNTGYARDLATSIGGFVPDPAIEQVGPEGEVARSVAGDYLNAHARREFNIPGITLGGRYDGSPVIMSDGTPLPTDAANHYEQTASPGGRAPHLWLPDGRSLFDTFGLEWTLLDFSGGGDGFARAAADLGVPLTRVQDLPKSAHDLYGADLALIRPDQIVAWRGAADSDAALVLANVTGRGNAAQVEQAA